MQNPRYKIPKGCQNIVSQSLRLKGSLKTLSVTGTNKQPWALTIYNNHNNNLLFVRRKIIFKYDLSGVVTMAELKARYNNVVETTFHFQTRVKFLLAVMWVERLPLA